MKVPPLQPKAPASGDPASLYKKPPSPETAALLSELEAKVRAPKKAKKGKPKGKPRKPRPQLPPQHDAHVRTAGPHLLLRRAAERLAMAPDPDWHPAIGGPSRGEPLGPEGWRILYGSPQATDMGPGFSAPGVRIA